MSFQKGEQAGGVQSGGTFPAISRLAGRVFGNGSSSSIRPVVRPMFASSSIVQDTSGVLVPSRASDANHSVHVGSVIPQADSFRSDGTPTRNDPLGLNNTTHDSSNPELFPGFSEVSEFSEASEVSNFSELSNQKLENMQGPSDRSLSAVVQESESLRSDRTPTGNRHRRLKNTVHDPSDFSLFPDFTKNSEVPEVSEVSDVSDFLELSNQKLKNMQGLSDSSLSEVVQEVESLRSDRTPTGNPHLGLKNAAHDPSDFSLFPDFAKNSEVPEVSDISDFLELSNQKLKNMRGLATSSLSEIFRESESLRSDGTATRNHRFRLNNTSHDRIDLSLFPDFAKSSEVSNISEVSNQKLKKMRGQSASVETPAPVFKLTIGKVEVRAEITGPPVPNPQPRRNTVPVLSLEEYLKMRNGGRK